MAKERMASAKNATKNNVPDAEMKYTLVCNYAQNMEMPYFGSTQPGKMHYFTPKTINLFGIVDCYPEKEVLYGYCYGEEDGQKGGLNVASLLMKHLEDCGLLSGVKRCRLNIVIDNCSGQNKNNMVLRFAAYFVEKGYFAQVEFIFLVVGHTGTKNVADHLFNICKSKYCKSNIFAFQLLLESLTHEQVKPFEVDWQVFKNWDVYLTTLYKANSSQSRNGSFYKLQTASGLPKLIAKAAIFLTERPLKNFWIHSINLA
jgi:hypothetical protein